MRLLLIAIASVILFFPTFWLLAPVFGVFWGAMLAAFMMYIVFPVAFLMRWGRRSRSRFIHAANTLIACCLLVALAWVAGQAISGRVALLNAAGLIGVYGFLAVFFLRHGYLPYQAREAESRVTVFFYGLFMDEGLLRREGLSPDVMGLAYVDDHRLVVGRRASIVPARGARVHGVLMQLPAVELERLYSGKGLAAYRPVRVDVCGTDGEPVESLVYVCDVGEDEAPEREYVDQLLALAERLGLPGDSLDELRRLRAKATGD